MSYNKTNLNALLLLINNYKEDAEKLKFQVRRIKNDSTLVRIQKQRFVCMNTRIYLLLLFCFALVKYYPARYLINNNDLDHTIHFMTCKQINH